MVSTIGKFVAVSGILALTSCGQKLGDVDSSGEKEPSELSEEDKIDVPITLTDRTNESAGLNLAAATAFQISLEGCASGYASTASEASPSLSAFKFDRDCLAKLTTFTVNGISYVPTVGSPFSTWLAGDTAIFEDSTDPGVTIQVSVVSQLDNPISGTEPIEYSFSEILAGADENLAESAVGDVHTMAVGGQSAPQFTINSVSLVGINANGGGEFEFVLECDTAISGTTLADTCGDAAFQDIKYDLVEDTFSGVLTEAQATTIISGATFKTLQAGEVVAAGGGVPNGGFASKTKASGEVLAGPDQMALKPNMILLLEANGSYTYFNVDVSGLTQTP